MIEKLAGKISGNPGLLKILKVTGWIVVIVCIVLTNMLMKEQEISFVYNNF